MGSTGRVSRGHAQLGTPGKSLFTRFATEADALKSINPHWGEGKAYSYNCALCTTAAALALRGYDVEAAPRDKIWRGFGNVFDFDWKNQDNFVSPATKVNYAGTDYRAVRDNPDKFTGRTDTVANKIDSTMSRWGNKSYAAMTVGWKGSNSYHSVLVYRDGNTTKIMDFQTGRVYAGKEAIRNYMSGCKPQSTALYRLDNAPIRDSIRDLDKIIVKKGGK